MISKVPLNCRIRSYKKKKQEIYTISDLCEAQKKYEMLKHSNGIVTLQYQQWTKLGHCYNGKERKLNLLYIPEYGHQGS